jgi:hypothetical protein
MFHSDVIHTHQQLGNITLSVYCWSTSSIWKIKLTYASLHTHTRHQKMPAVKVTHPNAKPADILLYLNGTIFEKEKKKNFLNIKCFNFFLQLLSYTFLILRTIQCDIIQCTQVFMQSIIRYSYPILMKV